jgi:hypothetical protein
VALLAEELVEEWLNRQGYFTIRGIKLGVDEIDLLATKFLKDGSVEYRHIEVQASMRPVSYITRISKIHLENGQSPTSAKTRGLEILEQGVKEWVEKKFNKSKKRKIMHQLCQYEWSSELVVNNVKSHEEVDLIREQGIKVIELSTIIRQLNSDGFLIQSASGADFVDLVNMGVKSV